ncbi:MAG: phospholipid carrier-dependent glycosyltransferase [Deltaproteobacteria bacterium]|nr:phospholipid carrier-dependent glycosyltransferase [Deltaproteobacteria bacterium]
MTAGDRASRWGTRAALAIAAAGTLWRLMLAQGPLDRLVATFVADDAFYYTQIARNWLAGHGPTFDGVAATNGFHPLWMLVSVAAQMVAGPDPEAVLRVLLAVSAICSFGTMAFVIWWTSRRIAPDAPIAAPLAAAFLAFNPFVVGTDLMGVEAPLAAFCGLLALTAHDAFTRAPRARLAVATGAACGLAFLARTDLGLLVLLIGLDVVRRAVKPTGDDVSTRPRITGTHFLVFALVAFAMAAPWLEWSLARFGTIWQDSGRVLMLRQHAIETATGQGGAAYLFACAVHGARDYGVRLMGGPDERFTIITLVHLVVAYIVLRARGVRASGSFPIIYAIFAAGIWTFYILVFRQQKYWYFSPVNLAAALLLARWCATARAALAERSLARGIAFASVAVVMLGSFAWISPDFYRNGFHPWQSSYLQVARDLADGRVPGIGAGDMIGAFNAGILGAFAPNRVINLDGVVHPPIIAAMREGRFMSYARGIGVDVLIDHQGLIETYALWSQNDPPTKFEMLARYSGVSVGGDYVVARIGDANP